MRETEDIIGSKQREKERGREGGMRVEEAKRGEREEKR